MSRMRDLFKSDQEKARVAQMISKSNDAHLQQMRAQGKAHMEALEAREAFEINARKNLVDDRNAMIKMRRRGGAR